MVKAFRYMLSVLEPQESRHWKILLALGFINPAVDALSFYVLINIINYAVSSEGKTGEVVLLAFAMSLFSLLRWALNLYSGRISSSFCNNGGHKLALKIFELFEKEDLPHHNEKTVMKSVTLIREDTVACMGIIVSFISILVSSVSLLVYCAFLAYRFHLLGAAGSFLLALYVFFLSRITAQKMKKLGETRRTTGIKANSQVTTSFGAFKELWIDNRFEVPLSRFARLNRENADAKMHFDYENAKISAFFQNSINILLYLALSVLLLTRADLTVVLAEAVLFVTILRRAIPAAQSIVSRKNSIEYSEKSFEATKENLRRYDELKARQEEEKKLRTKRITLAKGLFVRDLSFAHNEYTEIFDHASIEIPAGKSVAVIGPSGSGKTTFLDLILGLLKPQCGQILYDDYDIVSGQDPQGRCKGSLGGIVSYIPQTVYLNGVTICNNVAFFEEEESIDRARVEECLKLTRIWDDISRLPLGIDTEISENGITISGGQRQRIALARALYKQFELLVMDEATAALDMETEKAIIDSIRQVKSDKTLLMVTHHRSLANECDIVYEINNKKLIRIR